MSRQSGEQRAMITARAGRRAWLAAVFAATCPMMLGNPAIAGDEPVSVVLKNHQFEPRVVRVRPGQAIRFDNADDALHSLTLLGRENVIGDEFVEPGQSYTVRIPKDLPPGIYELACTIHVDMRGQLSVTGD